MSLLKRNFVYATGRTPTPVDMITLARIWRTGPTCYECVLFHRRK